MKPNIPLPQIHFTLGNSLITLAGLALLALGIYRTVPTTAWFIVSKNWALLLMLALFVGIMLGWYRPGGMMDGLKATARYGASFMPLMILLCLVMGIGGIITKWHEPEILSWIQRHHIFGSFGAALLTATPNSMIPITESCWKVEMLKPYCIFFMQAGALMSIPLFMLRATGFQPGSELPVRMWVTGFVVSVGMMVLAKPIYFAVEWLVPWVQLLLKFCRL